MDRTNNTLIFLHIPKAAGSTLQSIVARNYATVFSIGNKPPWTVEDLEQLPLAERARFQAVQGHCIFGLHKFLPQPAAYITMLRDPVERAVSHYYYVLRQPNHYLYDFVTSQKVGFRQYFESQVELDNGQVRMISGAGWTVPWGQCTREMLETAKRNLEQFAALGLAERFDESVLLYKRALGWEHPFYEKRNVTEKRPAKETFPQEDLEAFRRINALDYELYDHARGLFERAVRNQPGSFPSALEKFQRANAVFGHDKAHQERLEGYRRRWLPWVFWPGAWSARRKRDAIRKTIAAAQEAI